MSDDDRTGGESPTSVSRSEFVESMTGCLTADSKALDAPFVSPDDLPDDS